MKLLFANLLILLILSAALNGQDIYQQKLPASSLLKPTLKVACIKDVNYWKQPEAKNFWSWMPQLRFSVSGPIDDSSYLTYEFFTPDGKLWFSLDSAPFSIRDGEYRNFESEAVPRWTDKRSTILTGTFSFKITLKNTLQGTAKPFYQGKFMVKKEFAGTPLPDFKNQYLYYVDQDWMLPFAYLDFNTQEDANAPIFRASMWFRGEFNGKVKGYLFYNGKKVSDTETGGELQSDYVFIDGDSNNKFRWEKWSFSFYNTRLFDNEGGYQDRHILKNKLGNYEVKVLVDGELERIIPFTVGSDGKIVDSGLAKNNGLGGFGIVVPAKVIPTKEGLVDLNAYKLSAFYSTPLSGL